MASPNPLSACRKRRSRWNTGRSTLPSSAFNRKAGSRAEWGVSKNNQRAKYYRLTAAGRRQLVAETSRWERFVRAITGVLRPAEPRKGDENRRLRDIR